MSGIQNNYYEDWTTPNMTVINVENGAGNPKHSGCTNSLLFSQVCTLSARLSLSWRRLTLKCVRVCTHSSDYLLIYSHFTPTAKGTRWLRFMFQGQNHLTLLTNLLLDISLPHAWLFSIMWLNISNFIWCRFFNTVFYSILR